jgi:hypothetical protein
VTFNPRPAEGSGSSSKRRAFAVGDRAAGELAAFPGAATLVEVLSKCRNDLRLNPATRIHVLRSSYATSHGSGCYLPRL